MTFDNNKIDDAALALLSLTLHDHRSVWKGLDWAITNRLYEKGLIDNPVNKSKSLLLTDEGLQRARQKLTEFFATPDDNAQR